ncbi:MAG: ParB/RepB/Spo0J family partition protein [Candidatus Moranbacteria bacterium]|nr:ParB/RepB/Spo0J family partition protein [Candidatus Moranbacteria bacterium]
MAQQHGLGRGLSSLIPPKKDDKDSPFRDMTIKAMEAQGVDLSQTLKSAVSEPSAPVAPPVASTVSETMSSGMREVPVADIVPNPHQPRFHFDEGKLRELADSIREHGVIQALVVSPKPGGKYELIAGERRLQASKLAGLSKVPVIVRDAEEQEKLELAIIENVQRHDLNPIEEAKAYARLMDEFGLIQEEVAKKMGKSRSAVANIVRMLVLPVEIQRAVAEGKISEGHAKALLSVDNPEKQRALFELIVKLGLTVRATEAKVRETVVRSHIRHGSSLSPALVEKADRMSAVLGTKVAVKPAGKGGRIVVEYYSDEELDQIVSRLIPDMPA